MKTMVFCTKLRLVTDIMKKFKNIFSHDLAVDKAMTDFRECSTLKAYHGR